MADFQYNFEWDSNKAFLNLSKHKVAFEEAATIFLDSNIVSIYDNAHSEFEDRWVSIGLSDAGRLLVVCHTFREEDNENSMIRIFSSRKATGKERKNYEV